MREMPRRVNDAWRMSDSCSVVHPYYYCNHDTWPQINCNLQRTTDDQGSLVELTTTIPVHKQIHMLDHGEGFKYFKTVCALQGACRTLQVDAECLYGLSTLPQITAGIFPTFNSIDNRDTNLAQCDWGFTYYFNPSTWLYSMDLFKRFYLCW